MVNTYTSVNSTDSLRFTTGKLNRLSKVHILTSTALHINLNIDDTPITSRTHTQPSHVVSGKYIRVKHTDTRDITVAEITWVCAVPEGMGHDTQLMRYLVLALRHKFDALELKVDMFNSYSLTTPTPLFIYSP